MRWLAYGLLFGLMPLLSCIVCVGVTMTIGLRRKPEEVHGTFLAMILAGAFSWMVWTVVAVVLGQFFAATVYGTACASWLWHAYLYWKNRKNKRRKPSRAAGRVIDLGHRLGIAPA